MNNPLIFSDPLGTNVFGGFVSWIAGAGFDTSYNMGWSEAGQLGRAAAEGGGKGAAAWADGVVPFADPLEGLYANSNGSVDSVYKFSQAMGHVSRDAAIAAVSSPANVGQYIKNPKLYEVGSTAMRNTNYAKYGLDGLRAVDKGRRLISKVGSAGEVLKMTNMGKSISLWKTELTPGGGIMVITGSEVADIWGYQSSKGGKK